MSELIKIRNDRGDTVATFEMTDGTIIEKSMKGCYLTDVDEHSGQKEYRIDLSVSEDALSQFSSKRLADELVYRTNS